MRQIPAVLAAARRTALSSLTGALAFAIRLLGAGAALAFLAAFAAHSQPLFAAGAPELTQEAMRQATESFYSVALDSAKVYPIARAHLERDRLGIDLEGGALVLAQPILGRVTGACYTGKARLALTPPSATERASLKARIGAEQFAAETEALYLRFNDTTVADLTTGLAPAPDSDSAGRCAKIFASRNDVVRKYEEGTIGIPFNLEMDLLEGTLSPALARDFFLLETQVPGQGWVTYLQRPGRGPEVSLLHLKPGQVLFDPELWTNYNFEGLRKDSLSAQPAVDIVHEQMEIVIPNRSSFSIDALVSWKGPVEVRSARFSLINSYGGNTWNDSYGKEVAVSGVAAENGTPLPFVHRRHELLVGLPAPQAAGQMGKLRIGATEKTIEQITPESFSLLNTYPWFPQEAGYLGGEHTFDWTVKVMRPLTAAGSGTTVREWEDKEHKLNCAEWKSDKPRQFPSLIFGQFKESRSEYRRKSDGKPVTIILHWMPKITISDTSTSENYLSMSEEFIVPPSKPAQMVKDIATILGFYEEVLGPFDDDEIDVAQMGPGLWFGQAPPGLVQITSEFFLSQSLISRVYGDPRVMDFLHTVLAHEIAHHYWGDVVRWKSDQEQWLSESLAEYSAGLFLQAGEGDKAFRQRRDTWRKMCERWEGSLSISQANRASGETAGRVRTALLYNKGPLVLHMLRAQVGDGNFVKILKKVVADNRGKAIDTADFQAAAEAVAGYKLDWFFDQWVRGTGIPELHFSYTVTPQAGKYLLNARLTQADRAHPKALFIPVSFQFGGDKRGQKEWRVKGAEETLQLMLPEKPVKVLIDEPGNLLATIIYDSGG
jgi:hypothetical protein